MIAVLHPSFWQHVGAGLVVIFSVVVSLAIALVWLDRAVLNPRAAGHAWPEGARWARLVAELIADAARVPVEDVTFSTSVWQALRFGLVVATCVVVPLSSGLVIAQADLGIFVLAAALALDAGFRWAGSSARNQVDLAAGVALAGLVGLSGGAVAAQWGSGSLASIVAAQAETSIFGVAGWGLATAWVQPVAFVVAVMALHASGLVMLRTSAARRGGSLGMVAAFVDAAWIVAGSAWLVAAFAGGGDVPWKIDNDGVRQVVSVLVFVTKLGFVAFAAAWARRRWPSMSLRATRRLLPVGAVGAVCSIALTVAIRAAR